MPKVVVTPKPKSPPPDATAKPAEPKKPKQRSPNYPVVGLERAVELVTMLNEKYGTHKIHPPIVHKLWGFDENSNTANQCVAALKSYGLVDLTKNGAVNMVSISKAGLRIAANAPDRNELLKEAAVSPKVHKEILDNYGSDGLPADDILERYLVWDRPEGQRFNPAFVKKFIARLRASLAYAGIAAGDTIPEPPGNDDEESSGSSDSSESSSSSMSTSTSSSLSSSQAGMGGGLSSRSSSLSSSSKPQAPGMKQDVFSLDQGEMVVRWPDRIKGASKQDVDDWLKLVASKIKRAVEDAVPFQSGEEPEEEESE